MWLTALLLTFISLSFSLGLEDLISSALEKNPKVSSKGYAIESAKLKLKGTEQLYYPEFFAGYRYSVQSESQSISIPAPGGFPSFDFRSSKRNYQSLQLGLRQVLYDGGFRSSRVDISRVQLRISEEDYEETLLEVKLEVIKAYFSVLSALELLEVVKKQKEAVEADLVQREAFFREGLVAITDVLQAKVRLAEVQRDLREAEGNYRIAIANLSRLTGIEEEKLKTLKPADIKPDLPDLGELINTTMEKRPAIKTLREKILLLQAQRKMEVSQVYPKVFVEALYNYTDQNPTLSPKGFFVFNVGLSLNIQSLSNYYNALALVQEEKSAKEDLRDIQQVITLRVKSAYENFLTAQDNLRVAEESVKFAEEFYRLSLEQYRNQIISGTDLLQAEASRTQALRSKVIAYYKLLEAYFELLREVGKL
ncbi:TolC family protein [Pampinifervens florentissimum]|uniref:TolC family protein n=1 Tax=Pampinifervens florentissimum TaxID=1632019 RepID=UPI0013B479C3|nr:TolC family protein [Hydrogenobacter sp. T-8]QID32771.1 TolC family protein [Hydrogenobacter sp. T-8]